MIIAVNKWDALEKDDKTIYRFTEKVRNTLAYMPYAELLFISAKTGQRLPKLFETIDMVLQYQNLRVQTGVLNEILTEAMAMQQPPSDRGKRLKTKPRLRPGFVDTGFGQTADICYFRQRQRTDAFLLRSISGE